MAVHNNFPRNRPPQGWLDTIGNKVKKVGEIVGTAKGLWSVGKAIYHGAQAVAPYVTAAAAIISNSDTFI